VLSAGDKPVKQQIATNNFFYIERKTAPTFLGVGAVYAEEDA